MNASAPDQTPSGITFPHIGSTEHGIADKWRVEWNGEPVGLISKKRHLGAWVYTFWPDWDDPADFTAAVYCDTLAEAKAAAIAKVEGRE